MYKLGIIIQLMVAIAFTIAFALSFSEEESIKENSRVQVTEKVTNLVESRIDLAEELVNTKKAKALLEDHQLEVIHSEIALFRENPQQYVMQMTQDEVAVQKNEFKSKNPLTNALMDKVLGWKKGIKKHIEKAYSNLLLDIRIFCLTNVIGLLLASLILVKRDALGKHAVAASVILTGVISLSALSYLDQSWLYSILLNSYAGYGYPAGIFGTFLWVFYEYHYKNKVRE